MGLFDIFRKKAQDNQITEPTKPLEIPKEVFIDESEPGASAVPGGSTCMDTIYNFLQFDYESRAYNDALTNPDDSYRNDNISLLKQDLFILIDKSLTYYESLQKELDFHILSRGRAGLIDLVEELKTRKELVASYLEKIKTIKEESLKNEGAVKRITLSYQRGFMRGLSALTQSNVLNKNL